MRSQIAAGGVPEQLFPFLAIFWKTTGQTVILRNTMKRRWQKLCLLLVVAGLLAAVLWRREPTYQGRRLTSWVVDLNCYEFVEDREAAEAAFQHFGTNALPYLVAQISSKDSGLKQKVMNWNERFNKRWDRNLIKLTPADYRRSGASQAVGILGGDAAPIIPDLVANLSDPELAGDAANALGMIGDPALPAILAATASTNWCVRWSATVALAPFTNHPNATRILHKFARDDQAEVRQAAAETIGGFSNDPESNVPLLGAMLNDQSPSVRQSACAALINFGPDASPAAAALSNAMSDTTMITEVARVYRQIGPKAAIEILGLLSHPDRKVRLEAISMTGGLRRAGTNCLPALLPRLKDPEAKVRERTVQAIGSHRAAATNYVTDLLPLLNDSNRDVRIQTVMALRIIPTDPKPYIQTFVEAFNQEQDEIVRNSLLTAFEQFGEDAKAAVPTLVEFARTHMTEDRFAALLPLAAVDPVTARSLGAEDWFLEIARTNSMRLRMVFGLVTNSFVAP